MRIPIDKIRVSGKNPRKEMVGIEELAESVKEFDLIHPILVRPIGDQYEVVIGERRLLAYKKLGYKEIEAQVKDVKDEKVIEFMLVENLQRDDLTGPEKGEAIIRLQREYPEKYPTDESVAQKLKISFNRISTWKTLAEGLAPEVKDKVAPPRTGRGRVTSELGSLSEDQAQRIEQYTRGIPEEIRHVEQKKLTDRIIEEELTIAETRKVFKRMKERDVSFDEALEDVKSEPEPLIIYFPADVMAALEFEASVRMGISLQDLVVQIVRDALGVD